MSVLKGARIIKSFEYKDYAYLQLRNGSKMNGFRSEEGGIDRVAVALKTGMIEEKEVAKLKQQLRELSLPKITPVV